jgi:hypothetical protein
MKSNFILLIIESKIYLCGVIYIRSDSIIINVTVCDTLNLSEFEELVKDFINSYPLLFL